MQHPDVRNEQVLARQLSAAQQTMMALGGAIGTGLFLASGLAVNVAGPAVILSYVIVAAVALLLGRALTEMAVAHPTAGSFGVYAGIYVSPFAGYAVRVSYWLAEVIATGGQLVAASIYMSYWFPAVPGAIWVFLFGAALLYVNSRAVGKLGTIEYWLVMIKIAAIVLFVAFALVLVFGLGGEPAIGLRTITRDSGFFPYGLAGVWLGCCFVIYSFIGVEIVGVTSGEATDPARTIPRAMRRMVFGLSTIYIVTLTLLLALTSWRQLGIGESPFVQVLSRSGIPWAAGVMNFVVLSAALSSANANLYLIARTLFSLARGGFVPDALGKVTERDAPVNALLVSGGGLAAAVLVRAFWPESAYVWFFGVALFGALFVWLMIFVTHIAFRRTEALGRTDRAVRGAEAVRHTGGERRRAETVGHQSRRALPVGSVIGAALITAILVSTWWVRDLRSTLVSGVPWMLLLLAGYRWRSSRRAPQAALMLLLAPAIAGAAQSLAEADLQVGPHASPDTGAQVIVTPELDYVPTVDYARGKDRLDVYAPAGAADAPVVLMFHGGGLVEGDRRDERSFGNLLASLGYVVVVPSYRLTPPAIHPAHVADAAAAFAWVKRYAAGWGGNPQRVFVAGYSAGAYLAALLGTDEHFLAAHDLTTRAVAGLVLIAATYDLKHRPDHLKEPWGTDRRVWADASPAAHFGAHVPRTLMIIGNRDEPWRLRDHRDAAAALRKAGANVTLTIVPGRDHTTIRRAPGEEQAHETIEAIRAFMR